MFKDVSGVLIKTQFVVHGETLCHLSRFIINAGGVEGDVIGFSVCSEGIDKMFFGFACIQLKIVIGTSLCVVGNGVLIG